MQQKEITLSFDLDVEEERRVYDALMQLPEFYKMEPSKAMIHFINSLVVGIAQCEDRKTKCEALVKAMVGTGPWSKEIWN